MKKILVLLLFSLMTLPSWAQISGAGNVGCNGQPTTGTAWNSSTAANTTQILGSNIAGQEVLVVFDQTTTLTGGAITFQGDAGDGNFISLNGWQVVDPTSPAFSIITNPYSVVASTNKQFLVYMSGYYRLQIKLSTAITGTGSVTPFTNIICYTQPLKVFQDTNTNLNVSATFPSAQSVNNTQVGTNSTNVTQFGSNAVVTGTGAGGNGIPRVTISNDSSLAANQSVNVNQVGGTSIVADPCAANAGTLQSVNLTASGQVITGTASKQTYICSLDIVTATAQNIALVEGTGTTCATSIAGMAGGTTAATGWNFSANGGLVSGSGGNWVFRTATLADNVCLLLSGTGQTSGAIRYVQQ